jgi:hypothetical protein
MTLIVVWSSKDFRSIHNNRHPPTDCDFCLATTLMNLYYEIIYKSLTILLSRFESKVNQIHHKLDPQPIVLTCWIVPRALIFICVIVRFRWPNDVTKCDVPPIHESMHENIASVIVSNNTNHEKKEPLCEI